MGRNNLPYEPWRGGQICGYQIAYGLPWSEFCPERKADGLYFCEKHDRWVREEDGIVHIAPGNAMGDLSKPLTLLWEPLEGDPVHPTSEELARYLPLLKGHQDS